MSHRKVHSHGCIPFSWESSPGISKFAPKGGPIWKTPDSVHALFVDDDDPDLRVREPKIPPPPGTAQTPMGSGSVRARFRRVQDDPFLAAYKACTRSGGSVEVPTKVHRRGDEPGKKGLSRKKGLSMFSCKSSCDVMEDNFVKLSKNVPPLPLPRERTRSVVPVRNVN